jgi:hypothetical protein
VQVLKKIRCWQKTHVSYRTVPDTNASVVLWPTGSLGIQVLNASGQGVSEWQGRPLQVSVESSPKSARGSWGGSATIRPTGTYLFTGVHPGTYIVKLLNTPKQAIATVLPNQLAEVTMQLP